MNMVTVAKPRQTTLTVAPPLVDGRMRCVDTDLGEICASARPTEGWFGDADLWTFAGNRIPLELLTSPLPLQPFAGLDVTVEFRADGVEIRGMTVHARVVAHGWTARNSVTSSIVSPCLILDDALNTQWQTSFPRPLPPPVMEAPAWLAQHMEALRKKPAPTLSVVDTQLKASAAARRKLLANPNV